MTKKLWQGAFEGADKNITRFNSSENICLDSKLVYYDILGSIAHVKMLTNQGILKEEDANDIIKGLKQVLKEYEQGRFKLDESLEDVHTNVEVAVTKVTQQGKKMHTARSRNDQILLDMRMYMRNEVLVAGKEISKLQKSFAELAKKEGFMVGYTHTRVAQPITVSFWCDAHIRSFYRDLDKLLECYKRINSNPLGACALAGTSWNIDRGQTAQLLGFGSVQKNELDTVSSRGEVEAELLSHLSIIMAKLSGLAEELIWLSQKQLIELPEEFCTGSSIMPNKKNPDVLELIRGRTGRVYSNLLHVLTVKKGLISGYHSDMQETKYAVMSGIDTTRECITIMTKVVKQLKFNEEKIKEELEVGLAQATEIADALVKKGMSFREAHGMVGKLVNDCAKQNIVLSNSKPLHQFSESEWKKIISLDRKRLKVRITIDKKYEETLKQQNKTIEKAYEQLTEG